MKRIKPYLENKYLVSNVDKNIFLCNFKNILTPDENGINGHYYVSNIYFDTDSFDFYQDKLEGEFFKVKIRIRRYSLDKKNWSSPKLELKMKIGDRTSKISREITNKDVEKLLSVPVSGFEIMKKLDWDSKIPMDFLTKRVFKAINEVIYDRDAYFFNLVSDFRITFDYRIAMNNLLNNEVAIHKYLSDINNIFELKTNIKIPEIFLYW